MTDLHHISSNDRSLGTNENFTTYIDDITPDLDKELSIQSLSIPYSYYAINSNNNDFTVDFGTTSATITVTEGNYTLATIATELKTQMDASTSFTWTITGNNLTNKISYTTTDDFDIITDTVNYRWLGFDKSSTNSSSSSTLVSSNVVDLMATQYIDIRSNILVNSTYNRNRGDRYLLARIPTRVDNAFDTIFFSSQTMDFVKVKYQHINNISLQLLDDNGNELNLNGLPWNITLILRHVQKTNI